MTEGDEFLRAASAPRDAGHACGTLEEADALRPVSHNIFTAAILGDEACLREFLAEEPARVNAKGGPSDWDPLTYLCFSRYLRLDRNLSEAFVRTARVLLEAGANANTGWVEAADHPERQIFESVLYGAAGVAHHAGLTRLLLEYGADPNDGETPYHAPEGYDNEVVNVLLESGKLNGASLACMLARKADWHDYDGLRLLLQHGASPHGGLSHALRRDNSVQMIALLLDHGADPAWRSERDGRSAIEIAAWRGRGDVLAAFKQRGIDTRLDGLGGVIAACAEGDEVAARSLLAEQPRLLDSLTAHGGTLISEFAGNGNARGMETLLELGVDVQSVYEEGDGYFGIAKNSSALHVAAWRAWPEAVKLLLARGAAVNMRDAAGRTALGLAVKACVDSYWTNRRSPESVRALLEAGATAEGIKLPCGYEEVDRLFAGRSFRLESAK